MHPAVQADQCMRLVIIFGWRHSDGNKAGIAIRADEVKAAGSICKADKSGGVNSCGCIEQAHIQAKCISGIAPYIHPCVLVIAVKVSRKGYKGADGGICSRE